MERVILDVIVLSVLMEPSRKPCDVGRLKGSLFRLEKKRDVGEDSLVASQVNQPYRVEFEGLPGRDGQFIRAHRVVDVDIKYTPRVGISRGLHRTNEVRTTA